MTQEKNGWITMTSELIAIFIAIAMIAQDMAMIVMEEGKMLMKSDALERTSERTAKPIQDCPFPRCEECDEYHGHYCTVPMVVTKQIWLFTEDFLAKMSNRLTELETLVTEEILGSKEDADEVLDI